MNSYIGIDLGTSAVKILLTSVDGKILNSITKEYPIYYPKDKYSEQNPLDWFNQTIEGLKELLINQDKSSVKAISFSGQMHGLVMLDKCDNVLRNAILWNDSRSEKEVEYLNKTIGQEVISSYTGNIAFAGFTAPKILWVYQNERKLFDKIDKIMLPKDYLIYRLSGEFATDFSDASGFLLLDVKNRRYSQKMLEICHIDESMLPKLYNSFECVGLLKEDLAKELGLSKTVKIVAGAGDNAAAAVATNTIGDGPCNVSLGTSGTIFLSSEKFSLDDKNALHSFCDASGKYHLMGCILSAASARKWWLEDIVHSKDYQKDEEELKDSDVIFLPYLMGERSPHNDVNAKGAFINLKMTTTKGELSKAVMEGVSFALKDCLEVAISNGVKPTFFTLCGGGAKSNTWKKALVDILNIPCHELEFDYGPGFGACILAMVGDKAYLNVKEACNKLIKVKSIIYPDETKQEYYHNKYQKFRKLYPLLKELY